MNVKELIEEVENDVGLVSYLNRIPKKNKKTQAIYLESLNHLAYLLYLDGQEEMTKELLDRIIQVPFEGIITLGPLLIAVWFYWLIWKERQKIRYSSIKNSFYLH